jgi:hypothetical protein
VRSRGSESIRENIFLYERSLSLLKINQRRKFFAPITAKNTTYKATDPRDLSEKEAKVKLQDVKQNLPYHNHQSDREEDFR